MEITIQYFDSCPGWRVVDTRVKELVRQHGLDADLTYQLIDTPEAAEEYQFTGSPTLLVDGRDPFKTDLTPIGLACRTYMTPTGLAASPSVDQIREALGVKQPAEA